jgi:hypothetical protein
MVILLKDALQMMEAKDPVTGEYLAFDLGYCTFSRQRETGGKLIDYKNAKLTSNKLDGEKPSAAAPIAIESQELLAEGEIPVTRRNPFHRKNKTRNIELPNGELRKINFRLITSFNSHTIVY